MKSTKSLAFFFALVLSIVTIFATEKSFVLGGSAGWEECTENVRQISKTNGLYGYESLRIATKEHQIDKNTDLYLSFENKDGNITSDETGNYDVVEQNLYFSENAAVGYKACVSRENDVLIALTGNKNSLFGKIGPTGSFSIEFWLKPAVCVSGENVFFWRSSRNNSQYSEYQTIEASFMNGKLEWKFSNVFLDVDKKGTDIYLKSDTTILPEKWSHHYICYDEEEGTIEYYLDGHIESVVYVTDNGTSYGHYLTCVLGNPARIEICKNFTGAIDEFIISHDVKHYLDTNKDFRQTPAFVSVPLKATKNGCRVVSLESLSLVPEQTALQYFVRSADFSYTLMDSDNFNNGWVEVKNGIPESLVEGRYFQVLVYFFTDGEYAKSPILSQIELKYDEPDLPIPPSKIFAYATKDKITVSWSNNNLDAQYGYLLYYGTKSGEYIATGLEQGNSPIDCGGETTITLSGLEVGKVYYFVVASYFTKYPEIIGNTTQEVNARIMETK